MSATTRDLAAAGAASGAPSAAEPATSADASAGAAVPAGRDRAPSGAGAAAQASRDRAPSDAGAAPAAGAPGAAASSIEALPVVLQPHANLLKYYLLRSVLFGPALIFAAAAFYFRFRTLRYDVDREGITMRWGVLFRREVSLTYARIQDIQLSSNVVERWLGLARIQLQTASGSATAEMTIEGIRDVDAMRDFLYSRMRGATDLAPRTRGGHAMGSAAVPRGTATGSDRYAVTTATAQVPAEMAGDAAADVAALTAALESVANELRAIRAGLAGRGEGEVGHG